LNPSLGESYEKFEKNKKNKNIIQDHPYKLYVANENYQLVYCRYKGDPIVNDKFFMSKLYKL
jgi:effector-binding domain-containing protein